MERWMGRVALVTGASKGIGAAIAARLVECGLKVYACARNTDPIRLATEQLKTAKGSLHPIQCDLLHEDQILAMFEQIKSENGGVDILVNNAGIALPGQILTAKTEDLVVMQKLNVLAVSICSREAVKQMRDRKVDDGHVILINSASGHRVSSKPVLHFYSATKFAVTAMTEGLRAELRQIKSHIRVTSVSPGVTETPTHENYFTEQEKKELYEKLGNIVLEPNDVAESVVYVLGTPAHVQIHELTVKPLFHG